jgi:hypothetical protein
VNEGDTIVLKILQMHPSKNDDIPHLKDTIIYVFWSHIDQVYYVRGGRYCYKSQCSKTADAEQSLSPDTSGSQHLHPFSFQCHCALAIYDLLNNVISKKDIFSAEIRSYRNLSLDAAKITLSALEAGIKDVYDEPSESLEIFAYDLKQKHLTQEKVETWLSIVQNMHNGF